MTAMEGSPRPCRVVLSDALSELRDREARLAKLGAELAETRKAIKALRKLVGERATPLLTTGGGSVPSPEPERPARDRAKDGELKAAAIEAVRTSLDPLTKAEISGRMGRNGRGLHFALNAAVREGKLVLVGDDRYGFPAMAGASPEDQMVANGAG
jgi:hypothetical protein